MNFPVPPPAKLVPIAEAELILARDTTDETDAFLDGPKQGPIKATASELLASFTENLVTTDRQVSLQEFSDWLRERQWPDGRTETTSGGRLSIFQAFDGYAVKRVPVRDVTPAEAVIYGLPLGPRLSYADTTFTICTRVSLKPNRSVEP